MTLGIRPLTGKTLYSANGGVLGSANGAKGSPRYRANWNGNLFPPPQSGCVLYLPGHPATGTTITDFSNYFYDCTLDTAEALTDTETDLDCSADATTIIPAGSIIQVEDEQMRVTATGNPTITIVRGFNGTQPVAHDTAKNIFIRTANHGTLVGATWDTLPSGVRVNSFDGVDDVITILNSASINLIGVCTLSCWVNLRADENGGILDKTYTSGGYMLWIESLAAGFKLYISSAEQAFTGAVLLNTWYNLVGRVDGVANNLYLNGVAQTSLGLATPTGNTNNLFLGKDAGGRYPNCRASLFKAYNRALSATEITGTYQSERHLFGV